MAEEMEAEKETLTLTVAELEYLFSELLKEVFYATYRCRFGSITEVARERVEAAHPFELKDWIPHIVDSEKDDDIFVSSLERVVTQFAASVVRRKLGVDTGKVFRMKDLEKRIDSL
jgi:hypothetical protein